MWRAQFETDAFWEVSVKKRMTQAVMLGKKFATRVFGFSYRKRMMESGTPGRPQCATGKRMT